MKAPPTRPFRTAFVLLLLAYALQAWAQLEVVSNEAPQEVFGGGHGSLALVLHNGGAEIESRLSFRLYQLTSATAVLVRQTPAKRFQALGWQTLIETVSTDFPEVKATTPFLIQWIEGTNRVMGNTKVIAYPTNLLAELKTLAREVPLGVMDPNSQLTPLLKSLAVEYTDLEANGFESFAGALAIIGPFGSRSQMPPGLSERIAASAKKGKAIVWILPPQEPDEVLQPSFLPVKEGSGCVVVAQADMVSNLAQNPRAQLNLLHFARLALRPETPRLPQFIQ